MTMAVMGGLLLGLGTSLMRAALGRSEGVSGMAAGLFAAGGAERAVRAAFLVGLALAGGVGALAQPAAFADASGRPAWLFAAGGLIVGVGARVANGCTSGHGILGVARGSRRSVVAVTLFCAAAAAMVLAYPPAR